MTQGLFSFCSTEEPKFQSKLQPLEAFPKTVEELLQPVSAKERTGIDGTTHQIHGKIIFIEDHCPSMALYLHFGNPPMSGQIQQMHENYHGRIRNNPSNVWDLSERSAKWSLSPRNGLPCNVHKCGICLYESIGICLIEAEELGLMELIRKYWEYG